MLASLVSHAIVGRVGFQVDSLLQIQISDSAVDLTFHYDGAIRDAAVLLVVANSPHSVVVGQLPFVMRDTISFEIVTGLRGAVDAFQMSIEAGCHRPMACLKGEY
jgi:microcompartment protein CcmL/EutN